MSKRKRFRCIERLAPRFQQLGSRELRGQTCEQVDFLFGAQAGGVLGGQPRRDQWAGSLGIDLDQGPSGGRLQLRHCVQGHCLERRATESFWSDGTRLATARRRAAVSASVVGARTGLEPGKGGRVFACTRTQEAERVDQGDPGGDVRPGGLERGYDRLGHKGAARPLPRAVCLEHRADGSRGDFSRRGGRALEIRQDRLGDPPCPRGQ